MAGPGNILIKIGAEAGQAISELSSVNRALGDTMTSSEKFGAGLRKAALPAAAALTAIGAGAISAAKAAAEDAAEQQRLAGVLERTTGATTAQVSATEDWIASLSRATGVADDELRPAMAKLASATGDVHLAQKDLQTVLDVSAASGKSVEQVSTAIAKAYTGQTAGLNKLIPGLDQATLKSKDMSAIMGEIADKTGGAMAAQAQTATGQFAIFTNQMNELKESLGTALLPVLGNVTGALIKFGDFAAEHTTTIKVLIGAVAALAGGIIVANAAMKAYAAGQAIVKAATAAWTAAQWLLNAALDANPIGLVIIAVAALVTGIVIAYKESATFRNIVTAAFNAVSTAAHAVASAFQTVLSAATSAFNWIAAHWKVALFAFGPIGVAAALIADNFDKVKAAGEAAFDAITAAIKGIASAIESVIGAVQSLIGWLGKIHVPHINLPGPFMLPAPATAGVGARATGSSSTAAPVTINVFGALDPEGTARAIKRVLADRDRRMGRR